MFSKLKEKYLKEWVTDDQLDRYVDLKVITEKQKMDILKSKEATD